MPAPCPRQATAVCTVAAANRRAKQHGSAPGRAIERLRTASPFVLRSKSSQQRETGWRPAGTSDARGLAMDLLTWLIVGLIAGVLASLLVGAGGSILIDIVIGIVGAFIGGWVFRATGWHTPFAGLAGTIFIAFVGSVILLVVLQLVRGRPAL
jgi:uncharacterized membrane protein YeaQ/YmgE (transglycosylase-associated protein family)